MQWNARRWTRSSYRLSEYLCPLVAQLGRSERREAAVSYISSLLMPGLKKVLTPMAQASGLDAQRLQQFLSDSPWDEDRLWSGLKDVVRRLVGRPSAWVLYESIRLKQGVHSVGVSQQRAGSLQRPVNCQVAVELLLSDGYVAAPVGGRLFLPPGWCQDAPRMRRAQVPQEVGYLSKPEIAAQLIEESLLHGVPAAVVLGGETYGNCDVFRERLQSLGLQFSLEVAHDVAAMSTDARSTTASSLLAIAQSIPRSARHVVGWEDRKGRRRHTQLAWVRVRLAAQAKQGTELWLLADWVDDAAEPMRLFLSNLPALDEHQALQLARGRQLVSDHFDTINTQMGFHQLEARSWRAFHHHLALSGVALSFVLTERLRRQKALSLLAVPVEAAPQPPRTGATAQQPARGRPKMHAASSPSLTVGASH